MAKANRPSVCYVWTDRHQGVVSSPVQVLVVDEHVNAAHGVAAWLDAAGHACRVACGGLAAINIASDWRPDTILMDISMPDCDGYQAARALRRDSRTENIAIVAFTALDEAEVRRHLTDQEFDGYCQKGEGPSQPVHLIGRLAR